MNKQIDSNFGTETHHYGQTKQHSKMIKEWMPPQPIPSKSPSYNVNADLTNIQKQQMDLSNRYNYITSQKKEIIYRTQEPKLAVSTTDSLPDDLRKCTYLAISYFGCT